MIIQAFRNSQAINLVFLFFATFILRLPLYFLSTIPVIPIPEEPLSGFLFGLISPILIIPLFNIIFSSLLIYLQAVMINVMCRQYNILYKSTYLPGLMYVVFSSLFNIFLYTNTVLFANFFVILLIGQLFSLYKSNFSYQSVFLSGLIVATGTLFYFPLLLVFPIIWVSLFILRPFNWREYTIALLGFISPVFIIECISYLFNSNQWYLFESVQELITSFKIPAVNIDYLPFLGICALLFILSIVRFLVEGFGNTVKKQKSKNCFFWYMLLILPVFFISGTSYEKTMVFYSIPIAFLVGDFFGSIKRIKIANILLVIFVLAAGFYMLKKTTLI